MLKGIRWVSMEGIRNLLYNYLKEQDEVIIYGCGNNGRLLYWIFRENNIRIEFWCDKNEDFWNKEIDGIKCIRPDMLSQHSHAVLIVSMSQYKEAVLQLQKYAFRNLFTWDDVKFLKTEMTCDEILFKKYRKWVLECTLKLSETFKRNERFKNIHMGKRCFIIGNGPSVCSQNLFRLHDEITFTVNQIARNPQFKEINTNYHLWADPAFFKLNFTCDGDYDLLEIMKQLPKETESFFPYDFAHDYIEKYDLEKYIKVNYYKTGEVVNPDEEIDFTEFIRGGYTVVQYAIRLAIYMGFMEIYLLGCECTTILNVINARTSQYTSVTHCYDINEKEKERAKNMYFTLPMQDYYEAERGIMNEYHLLGEYCNKRGIKLVNCTPGGLLDEIPRGSYEKIIEL